MEKPESGTGTGTLKIETRVSWEALKPVPNTRVEKKIKMASSVIIVLRNFFSTVIVIPKMYSSRERAYLWLFSTCMCSTLPNMLTHHT